MTDIGKVISSGILTVAPSPDNCPDFIGYVTITGFGETKFMYFKKYNFTSGSLKFEELGINSGQEYTFDMCFMRIPSDFKYVAIDTRKPIDINDPTEIEKAIYTEPNSQKIYGLTLLNIHFPTTELEKRSPAQKTFIKIKTHYGEHFKGLNPIDTSATLSGKMGCKSLGFTSINSSQVPLFLGERTINHHPVVQYFMLTLGTEATIGYCIIKNKKDLIGEIIHIDNELQKNPKDPTHPKILYRLGVKLANREYYEVEGFHNKYGVHMIDRVVEADNSNTGWGVGWFKVIAY